jgi:glutaredoxin
MGKEKLITIGIIVLILFIAGGVIFLKNTSFIVQDTVPEEVARWIGEHSIIYTQTGCSHCIEQENLFGDNWKYLNSVDCVSSPKNTQACINANITVTPTWVINGKQYMGVHSIDTLKTLTGYK